MHYDDATQSLVVTVQLEPEEAALLSVILPEVFTSSAAQDALQSITRVEVIAPETSPAERGEILSIPRLVVRRGKQFSLFEEDSFLDYAWDLSQCDPILTESEYSGRRASGMDIEIDVTDRGRLKETFIPELHQTMTLFASDLGWTAANLVTWINYSTHQQDIIFRESNAFISRLVMHLLDDRGFELEQLVMDKYNLREAVIKKISAHRQEARKQAYNLMLLPESLTPLEVHPDICFTYPTDDYPYGRILHRNVSIQKTLL
jgi:type III restriction enzyme